MSIQLAVKQADGSITEKPIASAVSPAGGQLVPSVSHYQSGTVSTTTTEVINSWGSVGVTFDTPMPDTDYVVTFSNPATMHVHVQCAVNKTKTGFAVVYWYRDYGTFDIEWQAFKLITNETVNELESTVDSALPPISALDTTSTKAVNSTAVNSAITSKAVTLTGKAGAKSLFGYRTDNNLWYQRVVDADTPANMRQLEISDTVLRFITTENSGTSWSTKWTMYPLKTLTITNKTISLPTGGYVSWAGFTGLSQPRLGSFVMTSLSGAADDAWCSVKSSRYGMHLVFQNILTGAPLSGDITVSGTVYYM